MSDDTLWWWVRHAPVDHGGRIYGQLDKDCDTSDVDALAALAATLPVGAVWVTSHLKRTTQTAVAIAAAGIETPAPIVEPDLAEQHFGQWQGRAWEEVQTSGQPEYENFWSDIANTAPPGGESLAAMITRVSAVIGRLTEEHAGRDVVAVTHGGTIRAALSLALGLPPERVIRMRIDNLSLTCIDYIPKGLVNGRGPYWRVIGVNMPPR